MGQVSWTPRIVTTVQVEVTPVITASLAYVSGNQIGGVMTIPDVIRQDSNLGYGQSELHSISVLDGSNQSAIYDIWFFNQSPTLLSSDRIAFSITSANTLAQGLGAVQIGTSYSAGATTSTNLDGTNLSRNLKVLRTAAVPTHLYAVAVVRGTPTFTTTSSLKFIFTFYVD